MLATFIGSFGYTGYLKPAPGTWGSCLAAILWWFFVPQNILIQSALIFAMLVAGVWAANLLTAGSDDRDPSFIVADEVAGMWIALLGNVHVWWYFLVGFLLFRLFDIWKPGFINRLQSAPGGWGVMLDDVAAGILTLIVLRLAILGL